MPLLMRDSAGLAALLLLVASCSGNEPGSSTPDGSGEPRELSQPEPEDRVAGSDVGPAEPVLQALAAPFFVPPEESPAIWLEAPSPNGPGVITFHVWGRNLGLIAGAAFYVEYDPTMMRLVGSLNRAGLGDDGLSFTRAVIQELSPGRITYGVARFCNFKIPWGSVDQCGGITWESPTQMLSLTFELLAPGQSAVRFPKAHAVVRRPDRSIPAVSFVGATVTATVRGEP